MSAFSIRPIFADYLAIYHGETKAAIIYPADGDGRLAVYPNPDAYPGLTFAGLPAPIKPAFEPFDSPQQIAERFGIPSDAVEALAG